MSRGLEYALRRVHRAESELVAHLLRVADRHRAEHEVHHVCRDLAGWSRTNLAGLIEHAATYDVHLDPEPKQPGAIRHAIDAGLSALTADRAAAVELLEDLRDLCLMASETSLAWEMLAQHAQARRERDLLALTSGCHPQTLRQLRWINTTIKVQSPQALTSLDS